MPPIRISDTKNPTTERFDLGNTRYYERQFPEPEELVMVKVTRSTEMGAYVSLLEYNGIEGMILMSELSKRRIRSVKKVVRVGRHEVALVLRVDKEKGYIDLSKKRVSVEDNEKCEEQFSKSKRVHQIVCHIAQKFRIKVEELNRQVTWPLHKKHGHALDAFKDPNFSTTIIDELTISPEIREALITDIQLRLATTTMKMRARIDAWCYGTDGVNAIKAALAKGKEVAAEGQAEPDVSVKLIAPPQYTIITSCVDKADGEKRLTAAVKAIQEKIRTFKGGEAKQQGDFLIIGGEDERTVGEGGRSGSSESESSDEESEEEDEGMGLVEDSDMIPEEKIVDDEKKTTKK